MSLIIFSGLASLFGCACMFLVCAAQIEQLLAARQPALAQPWEPDFYAAPRAARLHISPAPYFVPAGVRA